MDPQIRRQRHLAGFDHLADLIKLFRLFFRIVGVEQAEIQFPLALVDMIFEKPACGLDVCVPRIERLMRMTVVARAAHYQRDIRRHGHDGFERLGLDDSGIRFVDLKELENDKYCRKYNDHDLTDFLEHIVCLGDVTTNFLPAHPSDPLDAWDIEQDAEDGEMMPTA